MSEIRLLDIEPKSYVPHLIHRGERVWTETNCSIDCWAELLHALGHEPLACMPCTLALDLEGDQWTFFKFPLDDVETLFGLETIELNLWWSLIDHVQDQLKHGRPVVVEMDAWFLPDTSGTSYKSQHVKTSIAVQLLDVANKRLGYFHNAGYHVLEGEDFDGVFRLDEQKWTADYLPPYAEAVKRDRERHLSESELRTRSTALLQKHLGRLPRGNPFTRYKARFAEDLAWVSERGMDAFHAYAFACLRQIGANFELLATYLRWLDAAGLADAASDFQTIAEGAKNMQFKLARAASGKRAIDHAALITVMEMAWATGIERLLTRYGKS